MNIRQEIEAVSSLIGQCYQDLHPSPTTVKSWTASPVFAPELWIWVMDEKKGVPVALGIAEVDSTIQEGSLEWIQVLPAYRGKGIGKAIVIELLSRLERQVEFTTVGGSLTDSTSNAIFV